MTHDPKQVLEAMCKATSLYPWDDLPEEEKEPFRELFTNALRAALAMGWKLVPREMTNEMMKRACYEDHWPSAWPDVLDAAPDVVGE